MNRLLLLLALLFAAPSWAAVKCKTPDGKIVYQDQSCAGGEKVDLSGAGEADLNSSGATYWRGEVARQERGRRAAQAIAQGQIFVGMTAQEAHRSWGAPTRVYRSVGPYGTHEQWVYDRGRFRAQYVNLQNGVVSSIQTQGE